SLSAILLDTYYFDLVKNCTRMIHRVPIASGFCLIPLKAKAWLNLTTLKASGEHVDRNNILKHRNDVFRLLLTITLEDQFPIHVAIRKDLRDFIAGLPEDSPEWISIKASLQSNNLKLPSPEETIKQFSEVYGL
ncbi:MAG TPA: hypothetical protein VH280_19000, partial [Verrucomicrobiae bacterium]|nr:hypothetical protein [Verrucomicrobiae bacterium]